MAAGKLTPRQRMINMMYLVLTALLALNVSKEIINAFVTVDESLRVSNNNVDDKNKKTYAAFAQAMQQDPKKYGDVDSKSKNIKKASDDLIAYIKGIKDSLVIQADAIKAGQPVPDLRDMKAKDNWDIPTTMMCGSANDGKGFKATELKNKLDDYKKAVLANLPNDTATQTKFRAELNGLLNTEDPDPKSTEYREDKKRTWEMSKFYHNPVVAAAALLTKFQGDIKNAESHSIDYLLSSVNINAVIMDVYKAKVIPNSTVVTTGSEYKADVFLSATSSTLAPEVFVGAHYDSSSKSCRGCDGKPLPVEEGIAKYVDRPGSEGEKKWGGVIRVKKPDLTYDYYNFESVYTAQRPNGVVSADKMNVLFIGLDNPVSVSVPGVPNNKVRPSITAGSLHPDPKAGAGHYIANVTSASPNVSINVSAEIDGKQTSMGKFDFRVKSVPNPTPTMGGKAEGGNINKNLLLASSLIPIMKDFYFELYWQITEFKMSIAGKGIEYTEFSGKGNQLDENMKAAITRARAGAKVYFEYIKARQLNTKDNSLRLLSPMTFVIQ
jgi:gliding motility-associated protein GldM